jgi:hypothetical protein
MPIFSLSDQQLRIVEVGAARVPVEKRSNFLQRVAARLTLTGRFNDDDVALAVNSALTGLVRPA